MLKMIKKTFEVKGEENLNYSPYIMDLIGYFFIPELYRDSADKTATLRHPKGTAET